LVNLFGSARRIESIVSSAVFGREVEDTATALLQFENGECASLTVTHASIEQQDTLDIYGTKGSIHIPVLNAGDVMVKIGNVETRESHPAAANLHAPLIEDFVDSVLNDREPVINGEVGRQISLMVEEIYAKGM
jgi:predicted dehydrogenase